MQILTFYKIQATNSKGFLMKKHIKLLLLITLTSLISCSKDEVTPYDHPFVSISFNNADAIQVNSNRGDIVSYYVSLSSKPLNKDLEVSYTVNLGDGLQEGIDFQLITSENPLIFPKGIYRCPIQIRWLSQPVDTQKDNTLTLQLTNNNLNLTMGLPGPDARLSALKITKVNP